MQISHAFSLTQSYRRQDERPAPDDFPRYTETASISKVAIDKAPLIKIINPLIMPYYFRSKLALENPVQLALILANSNIEDLFIDDYTKEIDMSVGKYDLIINPGIPIPEIPSESLQTNFPFRICYFEIPEFDDFPTNSIPNYEEATTNKIVLSRSIKKQVVAIYIIQSNTFATNDIIEVENTNDFEFLYIVPFLPKIQGTEVSVSGRINFGLEY